jgi:hypothetical protein
MSVSLEVAINNLLILRTFVDKEKPVCDTKTGTITKDDKAFAVSFRRWYQGALKVEIISATFAQVLECLKSNVINIYDQNDPESVKKHNEQMDHIRSNFLPALEGVQTIAQTYLNEDEENRKVILSFTRPDKKTLADSLQSIINTFRQNYNIPSAPPPPGLNFKVKTTLSAEVKLMNHIATEHAKKRTTHIPTKYQQDLQTELSQRFAVILKKTKPVEAKSLPESEPVGFNLSILENVRHLLEDEGEEDSGEWVVEKKETAKPPMLRCHSEVIPRPVKEASLHEVKPRTHSAERAKPKLNANVEDLMANFAAEIAMRRASIRGKTEPKK